MEIPKEIKNEIWEYCRQNNITNIDDFTLKLLKQGFTVEKYGIPVTTIVEKTVDVPIIDTKVIDSLKDETDKLKDTNDKLTKENNELKNQKDIYGER